MIVKVVAVCSVDGFITRHNEENIYTWTSLEDQAFFIKLKAGADAIVMGRKTYTAAREHIRQALSPQTLRVVLTRHPERYQADVVAGQLEFVAQKPAEIIARLEAEGREEVIIAGGGEVNALFMEAGLVTDVILTIEPWLFGRGGRLLSEQNVSQKLRLKRVEQLNSQGTVVCEYTIFEPLPPIPSRVPDPS